MALLLSLLALILLATQAPAAAGAVSPLAAFGSVGKGAGQLAHPPKGVAVDSSGRVYVSEFTNNRISVFNPDGSFAMAFGDSVIPGPPGGLEVCTAATTCGEGFLVGTAGAMAQPERLAFDSAGRLYVSDRVNKRIDVFNTSPPSFVEDVRLGGGHRQSGIRGLHGSQQLPDGAHRRGRRRVQRPQRHGGRCRRGRSTCPTWSTSG